MKSELIEVKEQKEKLKFPLLARSKSNGAIYLFSSRSSGTQLNDAGGIPIGSHSKFLIECDCLENWTILPPGTRLVLEV